MFHYWQEHSLIEILSLLSVSVNQRTEERGFENSYALHQHYKKGDRSIPDIY